MLCIGGNSSGAFVTPNSNRLLFRPGGEFEREFEREYAAGAEGALAFAED